MPSDAAGELDRSTHDVELGSRVVTKTFRSWTRGEHHREWAALGLLGRYASDLAPRPIQADLDAIPPVVLISRLPGAPPRPEYVPPFEQIAAAIALSQNAVPADVAARLPYRIWHPSDLLASLRAADWEVTRDDPEAVQAALDAARRWLAASALDAVIAEEVTPIFGRADGNIANHVWDGDCVRLVDFEDSGRSDRAFELADLAEHVSWYAHGFDPEPVLDMFDLASRERSRLSGVSPHVRAVLARGVATRRISASRARLPRSPDKRNEC